MGVTIHYRGRLREADLIEPLVQELQDICDINNWRYTLVPEDFGDFKKGMPDIRGIMFHVNEMIEPLVFVVNAHGCLRSVYDMIFERRLTEPTTSWVSAKTQSAGVEAHIKIINLLLHLRKRYFKRMEISDEGGYYPSKDKEQLAQRLDFIQNAINTIADVMEHGEFKGDTPDELVEEMRNAISKSFGNAEVRVIRLDANDSPESFREKIGGLIKKPEETDDSDEDDMLGEADWKDLERE